MPVNDPLETLDVDSVLRVYENDEKRARTTQSLTGAIGTDPDQHAEALRLQARTEIPADVVSRNMPEVKKKDALESLDIDQIIEPAPESEEWLQDPDNAKLVIDDPGMIGRIKKTLSDVPEAFARSDDRLEILNLADMEINGQATPEQSAQLRAMVDYMNENPLGTGGIISDMVIGAGENAMPMAYAATEWAKGGLATGLAFAGTTAVFAPATGPLTAITVPGAAASGFTMGSTAFGVREAMRQVRADAYTSLISLKDEYGNTIDPDVAKGAATIVGLATGPLEYLGLKKVLNTIPGAENLIKNLTKDKIVELLKKKAGREMLKKAGQKYAEAVATEGITEAAQQAAQILGEEYAKARENDENFADFEMRSFTEGARETGRAGFVGGGVGGIYATPSTVIGAGADYYRDRRYRNPNGVRAQVQQINENMRSGDGAKLFQRSPERFHALLDRLTGEERFYVSAPALREAVDAMSDDERNALFNMAPDMRVELENSAMTDADIAVKKSDYTAFIAPLPAADILADHIKLDPQDESVAERAARVSFIQNNPELIARIGQMGADQLPAAPEETYRAVERIVTKALQGAGRSSTEARAIAPLFARTLSRFAAPYGLNAVEQINQGLLQFESVDGQGQPVMRGSNIDVMLDDLEKVNAGKRVPGLDEPGKQALASFGARMKAAGITPESARSMGPDALIQALQSQQKPADSLDPQMGLDLGDMPNIDLTGENGSLSLSLSANTDSIEGIRQLSEQAAAGDQSAHEALNQMATNSLSRLLSGIQSVNIETDSNTGLYGGYVEPSIGVRVTFDEADRPAVLSALAQFAQNYNQEQVHVRQAVDDEPGTEYGDGSYATPVFKYNLSAPLTRAEIEQLIADSGLGGLTFNDAYIEAYYVGRPDDTTAIERFLTGRRTIEQSLGDSGGSIDTGNDRIWVYGEGEGAIPYGTITGDLQTPQPGADPNVQLIAERYFGSGVTPARQAPTITLQQASLQRRIAAEYELLPDNDITNPLVKRAYDELVAEVKDQYRALPIKVEAWDASKGEPYKNSEEMRRDVQDNNHMWFFTTTPESFGPPGVTFEGHPLLEETEFVTDNGHRMLANDLLRVVHDWYAHNLSPTSFGPLGEEAAWRNHMATIRSPWARWALTTETRGQNSWVNFNNEVYGLDIPLADRPFARQKAALLPIEYSMTGDDGVDANIQELMLQLSPEDQAGSLTPEQRVDPREFLEDDLSRLSQSDVDTAIQEALAEIERRPSTKSSPEYDMPERVALRQQIAAEIYGTGAMRKERTVEIILGPPAAGKSGIATPAAEMMGALIVDPDIAKEKLPEYDGGIGANAVHEESTDIIWGENGVLFRAMSAGDNIVLPRVGSKPAEIGEEIDFFTSKGYTVTVSLVSVSTEVALQRNQRRFFQTGRIILPDYIKMVGDNPTKAYELAKSKGVKRYAHINTEGQPPSIIDASDTATEVLYREFAERGARAANSQGNVGGQTAGSQTRLNQEERGSISFDGRAAQSDFAGRLQQVIIQFTERADPSTGIHEFSHWAVATHRLFAEMARERIAAGDTNTEIARINDDWELLKKNVGAESDVFTREQEEEVAKLFEVYMRDGNAPSEGLRRIFSRFRDWLTKIYKDITQMGVELDEDMRGIFDRWLASEEEIAKVQNKNSALAEIAKNLGLDDNIATQIADYVNSAMINAEEKLYRELNKEQKRRETKAYQEEFAAVRKAVAAEFEDKREYSLVRYMKDNGFKFLEGPETDGVQTDILSDNAESEKIIFPDDIADLYGFDSGMSMLRALRRLPDFDRAVDAETRKRLLKKYPDMIQSGQIRVAAVDAIVNDRVLLALDLMVRELGRQYGATQQVSMKQFAKIMARAQVEKMKMNEVNYAFRFEVARDKEMRLALIASREGKADQALLHLQRAMVNQTVFKSLEEFKDIRDKAQELFRRVQQKDKVLSQNRDMEWVEAARHLLWKFGLGGEQHNMKQWMEDLQEREQDNAPFIMENLAPYMDVEAEPNKDSGDLTTVEFLKIYNAIQNIFSEARRMKEMQREGKRVLVESVVTEMTDRIGAERFPLSESTQITGWDRLRFNISTLKAVFRRVEFWAKAMDGGYAGPFRDYLWNPLNDAENEYISARTKWLKEYRDILKKYKKRLSQRAKIDSGMYKSDALGRVSKLVWRDPLEMVGFLLHTGNESNLDKLLGGYGIEPSEYQSAIQSLEQRGIITKEDRDLVQELWDLAEKLKPVAQKAHKDIFGFRFYEVEASPVLSRHGIYRGGYWPAVADSEQAVNNKLTEQMLSNTRQYMLATTNKGFTKGRVQGYRQPLKTDLRLGSQHIDQVLRFAYLEPAARDARYLLRNQRLRDALKAVDPDVYDGMLLPFLRRFVEQTTEPRPEPGDLSAKMGRQIITLFRSSATSQLIRYNPLTAVQNFANLSVAFKLVGPREFARSLAIWMRNPIGAHKRMTVASDMMRNRFNVNAVKIMNEIDEMAGRKNPFTKGKNFTVRNGWIFMMAVDSMVGAVTWNAAYNNYATQNPGAPEADVIRHADTVTREVLGGMGSKDISKFEASHPLVSTLIAPFMGYFNSQANLMGTEFKNIMERHGWNGTPRLFYAYMMIVAVPAILSAILRDALRGDLPDDDDDDGEVLDDWLAYMTSEQLKYLGAMAPIVGQGVTLAVNMTNDNPIDDRISASPATSILEGTFRTVKNLYRAGEGEEVDDSTLIRGALTSLGFVTGYPLGQLGKPFGFIADVAEGDSEPEDALDWARGLVGGPAPQKR